MTGLEAQKTQPPDDTVPIRLLRPIFEWLGKGEATPKEAGYAYPFAPMAADSIFPRKISADNTNNLQESYNSFFNEFQSALKGLQHKDPRTSHLWFENFESLMMLYMSALPASQATDAAGSDVFLYDYARIEAAFAVADALYKRQTSPSASSDKYMIISGGISGIQNFILRGYGDSRKHRAKLLRGRFFAVSLLSELCADMLCRYIGLPSTSVILNAAGRFTRLAPDTVETRNAVEQVSEKVNKWLIKHTYGETNITLSKLVANRQVFEGEALRGLWNQLERRKEECKFQKINLAEFGGRIKEYQESFKNEFTPSLCPVCGKRPSQLKIHGQVSCELCRDHIFLGEHLVKEDRLAVIQAKAASDHGIKGLHIPLFYEYQIVFGPVDDLLKKVPDAVLKYWDLSNTPDGSLAVKFINGYVPVCTDADEEYKKHLSGDESDSIRPGQPQTLNLIAFKAQKEIKKGKFQGVAALGVLKADVDDLGRLMACGLGTEQFTLPRLATLSRQMNNFFAVYLPRLLENELQGQFSDVYTVFAGGDDLFLIGPWNRMIELAAHLRKEFARYVCHNANIHFCAGISLHKSHTPIDLMAQTSEEELDKAKNESSAKNRLTLFGETVLWHEVEALNEIKIRLEAWLDDADATINTAMLFRLNELMAMAAQEKRMNATVSADFADMSCAKWRSMVAYTVARNVGQKIRNDPKRKQAIAKEVVEAFYKWLEKYGNKMKIPVWQILYNRR
jgi:CRISPR-associated protein Csm1